MSTKNQTKGFSPRNKYVQPLRADTNVTSEQSESTTHVAENIYVKKKSSPQTSYIVK